MFWFTARFEKQLAIGELAGNGSQHWKFRPRPYWNEHPNASG